MFGNAQLNLQKPFILSQVNISLGSLAELETHLILVDKLNVAKIPDKVQEELGEIRRMLIGLISLLERTK